MLQQLVQAVQPPRGRPADVDWDLAERQAGSRLPADYKALVEMYGPGSWDGFLHVFQPMCENQHIDLARQQEPALWALDYLQVRGEPMPYPLSELMAVAGTDNGDTVYWLERPHEDPDAWTIVVNEARGPEWVAYDGGLVAFLADVLSRAFQCDVFPDDFPGTHPRFQPYE